MLDCISGFGVLLILVFIISITWTRMRGAPWLPTSMRTVRAMLSIADVGPDDVVFDLGCGDGRLVITAAQEYGARAVGIEIDPLRFLWCQMLVTVLGLRSRIRIIYGDFFAQDLSGADVVTCYLLQDTNNRLEEKLTRELRPGTRVVSNTFTFPGLDPVGEDGGARLYVSNQQLIVLLMGAVLRTHPYSSNRLPPKPKPDEQLVPKISILLLAPILFAFRVWIEVLE